MASREEILSRLIDVVVQVTLADKAAVDKKSQLYEDLGVESIDFIDIIFNCETEFDIKEIPNDSIFTDRDFVKEGSGNLEDGCLTDEGKEVLKAFPYLNPARLHNSDVTKYLYSMEMLVDYIEYRLKENV